VKDLLKRKNYNLGSLPHIHLPTLPLVRAIAVTACPDEYREGVVGFEPEMRNKMNLSLP
jgi:hypothetical protein